MAKKHSGGIVVATGFRVDDPTPLDDRLVVENISDLTNSDTFPNIYGGILVSVVNDSYNLYKWNGKDRTNLSNWINTLDESVVTVGRSSVTGSLIISGSSSEPFAGTLTVSDTIFTDVISASIAQFTGDGSNSILIITSGSNSPITINREGLIVFDQFNYTPTPVAGGFLYSGSDFFIGLEC